MPASIKITCGRCQHEFWVSSASAGDVCTCTACGQRNRASKLKEPPTKRISAEELGTYLFGLLGELVKQDKPEAFTQQAGYEGSAFSIPQEIIAEVKWELFFLEAFAIDFATAKALGVNSPLKNRALDDFFGRVEAGCREEEAQALLKQRQLEYFVGLTSDDPANDIGRIFAGNCGNEYNLALRTLGSATFVATFQSTRQLIDQYEVR